MIHPANKNLPMMWIKGNADDIVPQAHQDEIRPVLEDAGFPIEFKEFNGKHDLTDPAVIGHVSGFINKHLTMAPIKAFQMPAMPATPAAGANMQNPQTAR